MTLKGRNGTQIHNVAPGSASTDAANWGQVQAVGHKTLDWADIYTDQKAQQTLNSANGYTDMKINAAYEDFNHKIRKLRRDTNSGIAGAMALANLPQASIGQYGGQESFAVGGSWSLNNGVMLSAGGTVSTRGKGGFGAGAGYQW